MKQRVEMENRGNANRSFSVNVSFGFLLFAFHIASIQGIHSVHINDEPGYFCFDLMSKLNAEHTQVHRLSAPTSRRSRNSTTIHNNIDNNYCLSSEKNLWHLFIYLLISPATDNLFEQLIHKCTRTQSVRIRIRVIFSSNLPAELFSFVFLYTRKRHIFIDALVILSTMQDT